HCDGHARAVSPEPVGRPSPDRAQYRRRSAKPAATLIQMSDFVNCLNVVAAFARDKQRSRESCWRFNASTLRPSNFSLSSHKEERVGERRPFGTPLSGSLPARASQGEREPDFDRQFVIRLFSIVCWN